MCVFLLRCPLLCSTTTVLIVVIIIVYMVAPVAQRYLVTLLTRWDVSSIPANGIFLTKKLKLKLKMLNGRRAIKSLVHKIRLHSR